jgi:hypothetical protein
VHLLVTASDPPPARRFGTLYPQDVAKVPKAAGADMGGGAHGDADIAASWADAYVGRMHALCVAALAWGEVGGVRARARTR